MKARLTRLVGLALTVVFLVLALQRVDLPAFVDELRHVNYIWLIPSAMCTLLGYVLQRTVLERSLRSGILVPLLTTFGLSIVLQNLRLEKFSPDVRSLGGQAERVFDGITLIALLAVVSIAIQLPEKGREVELIAGAIFLVATLGLVVLLWKPAVVRVPLRRILALFHGGLAAWIEERFESFVDGISPLRSGPVLLFAAALSAGVWLLEGGSYLLLSRGLSLNLPSNLELPGLGLALVTINLGIMIPSGPGYVGTQEFFGTAALGAVGANPQAALALIVVSHAMQYVLITGLGLVFFAREQLSPRDLRPALVEPIA